MSGTLIDINSPAIYEKEIEIRKIENSTIAPLADKYISNKALVSQFKEELLFWVARNDYMVKKIKEISSSQKEKKVIVLTGISHKYYLVDKLKNQQGIYLNGK
jgi:hypothetical protein